MLRSTIHLTTCRGRRILVIYYVKCVYNCSFCYIFSSPFNLISLKALCIICRNRNFPPFALMLFKVVSRKTSPTTSFPSSVTSLKATGTTFGSPFAHVARSHIPFFNTLITDSFNIAYTSRFLSMIIYLMYSC